MLTAENVYLEGLRALGIDPAGPADQVQQLRDRAERAEARAQQYTTYHDQAYYYAVQERDDAREEAKRLRADVEGLSRHATERDELREKLDKTLTELEALRAKCTPSQDAIDFARLQYHANIAVPARDFILALAEVTKPKRKTRLEAACESLGHALGLFGGPQIRSALEAAGVDPDEEVPQ